MKRRKRKSKIGKTGCLFWLLILLIVIIIFLYKGKGSFKDTINYFKNLTSKGKTTEIAKKNTSESRPTATKSQKQTNKENVKAEKKIINNETSKSKTELVENSSQKPKNITKTKKSRNKTKISNKTKKKYLISNIYFIKIDLDGSARPYPLKKKIAYIDSPITRTLNILLEGPDPPDKKKGIISFIPRNTKLLSATLKKGNLILNFNGSLEENYSGRDAIMLELSQILYTCFEFDVVKSVTILINGKRKQYITGEGIPLKSKYSRADLKNIWPS